MVKVNDSVTVVVYGETQTGKVERIGPRSKSIIWVRMDVSKRLQWFHVQSLTITNGGK